MYRSGMFPWKGLTFWVVKHREWSSWAAREVFLARQIFSGKEIRPVARIFFEGVSKLVNKKRLIKCYK